MEVLDQRLAKRFGVVRLAHDGRDRGQPRQTGRSEPPLSGNQLVAGITPPDHDGLQHADLPDRTGQGRQRLLIELQPRLARVRRDRAHRDLEQTTLLRRPRDQ